MNLNQLDIHGSDREIAKYEYEQEAGLRLWDSKIDGEKIFLKTRGDIIEPIIIKEAKLIVPTEMRYKNYPPPEFDDSHMNRWNLCSFIPPLTQMPAFYDPVRDNEEREKRWKKMMTEKQALKDLENEEKVKNAILRKNIYDLESLVPEKCSLDMKLHIKERNGTETIETPIFLCVKTKWAVGVRYLIGRYRLYNRLADLEKKDESGRSLVHCAIANNEIMNMLFDAGMNPLVRDNEQNTPMMIINTLLRLNLLHEKNKQEAIKNKQLIEETVRKRLGKDISSNKTNDN